MLLPLTLLLQAADPFDAGPNPLLMQRPTINRTHIAFEFAGDLWSVPRAGGAATRLTSAPGRESRPYFSPDGTKLAFSGQYDGNTDAFVMPASGGQPKRLTAHPAADEVMGWTNDGKQVLVSSSMLSNTDYARMFSVPATGGIPKELPFPAGVEVSFSPDSTHIAYVPYGKWQQAWKRYRGGQASRIWIGAMSDSKVKELPRKDNEDSHPMWIGNSIYFLSDRNGPFGLFRYDRQSGSVIEEVKGSGFDIKSASAGADVIVYEKLGSIHIFDPKTKSTSQVPITIEGDFPEQRKRIKDVRSAIQSASLSPTGQRIAVGARGWVFTIPAAKGDARLIKEEQGVHRRDPAWSPDGKSLAFITDIQGDQQLALVDMSSNVERRIDLGEKPGYYSSPTWSPDSKKIAYTDNKLNLWVLDVASGTNTKVDTRTYRGRGSFRARWSPDSKWLTWSRDLKTHVLAIFLYNLDTGKKTQITDGLSDANMPVFDRDGKHLYFLASTNVGMGLDFEDMSGMAAEPSTSCIYAVVLSKEGPNPLHPESDEEGLMKEEKKPEAAPVTKIDVDGIERRIIVLPTPTQGYQTLEAGPAGTLYAAIFGQGTPPAIMQFAWKDRKLTPFVSGISGFQVSADGSKILLRVGQSFRIVPTAAPPAAGSGDVPAAALNVRIDPVVEWRKMFEEVWRGEKLLFFDPNLNGADAAVLQKRYEPFLKNIASRSDLNYLFSDMLGELVIGHMWARGGDIPGSQSVPGGLLGADFEFANGRYKITRIYDGERWNPELYSPLAQPGINAQVGEYVLAIDGNELTQVNDIYETLEAKAGKQVRVKLGPNPSGVGAREVIVLPVANEYGLRFKAWIEDNRRYVEKMTGGRAGYVHVPDTGGGGWTEFQRYYYSQSDKDGMIVDGRFNHGGLINDFMPNEMMRQLDFGSRTRYGEDMRLPLTGIFGPKVMLTNEQSGSGGDIFPFLFKQRKIGKLIGTRTWGGHLIAASFPLIDGGSINAPDDALYDPKTGKILLENVGTVPDIEVQFDPYLWRQGKDAQLERAILEINASLKNYKLDVKKPPRPVAAKGGG